MEQSVVSSSNQYYYSKRKLKSPVVYMDEEVHRQHMRKLPWQQ
jgi:hypothetical protein